VAIVLATSCAGATATVVGRTGPAVRLSISYFNGTTGHLQATLSCRPKPQRATGFLARRSTVLLCRRAVQLRSFLASSPDPRRLCSLIYGGPQRAVISGTIGRTQIHRRFARTNGCEIADWSRVYLLLPTVRTLGSRLSDAGGF
jgi:hypothetical protein